MEGLLILFGELLALPLLAGITVLVDLLAALVSLVLQFFFGIEWKPKKRDAKHHFRIPPKVLKWTLGLSLGSLALFAVALIVINSFYFAETVRYAADRVEAKTGIAIQYQSVEGSLFTGRFAFAELDLKQAAPDKPQFDIQAQTLRANLSLWDVLLGRRVVESALLSHAAITFQTLSKQETKESSDTHYLHIGVSFAKDRLDGLTAGSSKRPISQIPNYTIENLTLEDVRVRIEDRAAEFPVSYDVVLNRFEATPLRSHFAIFDFLFRSNLDATLNGSRLEIVNTEADGMRHTQWSTQGVPAPVLASVIGGPFALFEKGAVDVTVTDQWEASRVETLELDWTIKVSGPQARLPQSTPTFLKPLAQVWVDNINDNPQDWEFGFQLQLAESQFRGATSLNAQQIWQDSIPVFLKQTSQLLDVEESTVKETGKKVFDGFKRFIEPRSE